MVNVLGEAERVEIVTLIDNYIDVLIPSRLNVARAPYYRDGTVASPLVAEHGLSLLVRVFGNGISHTLLLDGGWSPGGLLHNMTELGITVPEIECMVLSHGHMDHHGGLQALLRQRSTSVPVIVHPDAFLKERYLVLPQGEKVAFPLLDEALLSQAGAHFIRNSSPLLLASDLVLVTGEIERTTDFEKGIPNAFAKRDEQVERDCILDDQALVINVKGKGLVIIAGCSHAGIINTIHYARKITGVQLVHAVIGGFHLSGKAFEPSIGKTVEALTAINPTYISPMHCTGWKTMMEIAHAMPSRFVLSSVGTTIRL